MNKQLLHACVQKHESEIAESVWRESEIEEQKGN
jgi:hypothetical protein